MSSRPGAGIAFTSAEAGSKVTAPEGKSMKAPLRAAWLNSVIGRRHLNPGGLKGMTVDAADADGEGVTAAMGEVEGGPAWIGASAQAHTSPTKARLAHHLMPLQTCPDRAAL